MQIYIKFTLLFIVFFMIHTIEAVEIGKIEDDADYDRASLHFHKTKASSSHWKACHDNYHFISSRYKSSFLSLTTIQVSPVLTFIRNASLAWNPPKNI